MTDKLTIELQDADLLAAVDRALAALEHPHEMLDAIGARLEGNAEQRFETKTDPSGTAWAPLSPATRAIYESEWFIKLNPTFAGGIPGTLLERTRQMRASLAHNTGDDWVEIGTARATKGGRWQVGTLHEWGTTKMPRRGLLVANPAAGALGAGDQEDVLDIVRRALGAALT